MVWSFWPLGNGANYNLIGPHRNAKDLRGAKSHWVSGGVVSTQRSPCGIASTVRKGAHERTTEEGTMLNVAIHPSAGSTGPLAREIEMAGECFAWRAAFPHATVPTARYYALTRTDLATHQSRPAYL